MSRFGDLIRGKANPTPQPNPEPVIQKTPEKISEFLSSRVKRDTKVRKTTQE